MWVKGCCGEGLQVACAQQTYGGGGYGVRAGHILSVGLDVCVSCRRCPWKVADIGGWVMSYGSLTAMDKALDADPCMNHSFLQQSETLIQRKIANPALRVGKSDCMFMAESVKVTEEKRQGIKKPKRKFMSLEKWEKLHGPVEASRIKCHRIDGVEIRGVDYIEEGDKDIYEYIDESVGTVARETQLSNPDLVLSADQTSTIFSAASKQLSMAPKEDNACFVLPSSSASSTLPGSSCNPSGGVSAAPTEDISAISYY